MVGRSVKSLYFHYFFGQKCEFYACFTLIGSWEGGKKIRVGIFFRPQQYILSSSTGSTFLLALVGFDLRQLDIIICSNGST